MSEGEFAIPATKETVFFSRRQGGLCQWIMTTIENRSERSVRGTVTIEAAGKQVTTPLEIGPGVGKYRCHAPALWPERPPTDEAPVRLKVGEAAVTSAAAVGHHRPWTVYLLSDVCTDYTWAYGDEQRVRSDDADLTEAEIAQAEATEGGPAASRNHYNLVHAREVEFYLERYPDRAARLFDHIRRGTITLNPFFNMCLTADMGLEGLIRHFYPARAWAVQHGLELAYANHQETPTLTWAMAGVLAGCGVGHLVKSILPHECPWVGRLAEPPIFRWEGPDGSRVLVRRRNEDYVEGRFVLDDFQSLLSTLHETVLPGYEDFGEAYPFDAVGLVGCYGDLSPRSRDLPAKKAAAIARYNAQEWDYPRLFNASHRQFWDDIEAQMAERAVDLPVYRGDYGAAWDVWPTCMAGYFAGWRRAQERAGTADGLAAVLSRLDPGWLESNRERLAEGRMNLLYLADHAWNGASDANRALNLSLRGRWQQAANIALDAVVADGLCALSSRVPTGDGRRILVFNGLGWSRSGVVRVDAPEGDVCVVDAATGEDVACQIAGDSEGRGLFFEAPQVPSAGYRVFEIRKPSSPPAPRRNRIRCHATGLDGPYYAVEVSPVTGGIVSLHDRLRDLELVDPAGPHHLNQCLYLLNGVEHTPTSARFECRSSGPAFGRLIVRASLKNIELTTTIMLYAHMDRLDIRNDVVKQVTTDEEELDFAFPFNVPNHRYRYEAPGAILTPGEDHRPGAGLAVTAVRHFVDVFNDEFGVTLSAADSGFVEFGHRTTKEDPRWPDMSRSTVLALALQNCVDRGEAVLDQAGVTHFTFRYGLRGHDGGFDPVAAVRFGWEDNNELLAVPSPPGQGGDLPQDAHSFLRVAPDNVVLTCLKVAEEDGLIVRLWECAGQDSTATIHAAGLGAIRAAERTDLLERNGEPLPTNGGQVTAPVRAFGLTTVRLLF